MTGDLLRTEGVALAARARCLGEVARDAIGWLHDNAGLVGNRMQALEHTCRRHAVEARRLAAAAERPMSVGVFGPSQAGKSFLVGSLITPSGGPAHAVFGEGAGARRLDFLEEVNPVGGKETTGVVTRFSIRPHPGLAGHEVVLRLLREVDVIKILANSFIHDLGGPGDTVDELTGDGLAALESLAARERRPAPVDALALEDIFELRAYLGHKLARHALTDRAAGTLAARYWALAESALPHLPATVRAEVLAPLWGGLPELTALYSELKAALDQLRLPSGTLPEHVCVPLAAITDRAASLVHVDTLLGLDAPATGQSLSVAVPGGPTVQLRKPVVTALTAELCITLDKAAWPLFTHTDLLDFPGARSREDSTPQHLLRNPEMPAGRAQCFLRGKVAVLFDNYAADLDLNVMLLCVGPENQEVKKLPELVEDWIRETHGATPEIRRDCRTSLFLCLTKSDTLFDVKTGGSSTTAIANRFQSNIESFPGWTANWTPGRPFDNVMLIRNPKGLKRDDLFLYAPGGTDSKGSLPAETGLRPDKAGFIEERRAAFLDDPLVRQHVAEAADRWAAMLALNDGGISHLADRLEPVCDPALKLGQIAPRVATLAEELSSELKVFHESGDLQERVKERLGAINEVVEVFQRRPKLLGLFLATLHADPARLGRRFLEIARRSATAGGLASDDERDHAGIRIDLDGHEPVPARTMPMRFGDALVGTWLEEIERRAGDEELARAVGLSCEQFRTVAAELAVAARRFATAGQVETYVRKTVAFAQAASDVVHRVEMGSAVIIDRLVNRLGTDQLPPEREDVPRAPVWPRPAPGDVPDLAADLQDMAVERDRWAHFWLLALRLATRENATWGQGQLVDIEENERLGRLLDRLRD